MTLLSSTSNTIRRITLWNIAAYLAVFCANYIAAQLGLYIFNDLHSSPALIWPSAGISLAALYLGGWEMSIPVLLSYALALKNLPITPIVIVVFALSYTLQAMVGAWFLRRPWFDSRFESTRSALWFIVIALGSMIVAPSINTTVLWATHALSASYFFTWARAWGGSATSAIIVAPLILSWADWRGLRTGPRSAIEIFSSLLVTGVLVWFVFWTQYLVPLGILIIFVLPVVYVWFVFRMRPRWLAAAIFITAALGIAGSIATTSQPWVHTTLNAQLIADELYIAALAALFLVFSAVAEERRKAILETQEHNQELKLALEQLSAEDRAKTEFIAILAHELRNPLAPIVSAHEWLLLHEQEPEARQALQSAQKHAIMMRHLLDDLLDTARVSQQRFTLKKEPTSLEEAIAQSIESTADFLQNRRHSLRVERPGRDVILFADPIRLKQIIINLLNNAGKYTEPGGKITLAANVEGKEAVIRVSDTGVGMEQEILLSIFEPFRRYAPDMNLGTGLGIGLTLTKRLVEMHGGTIEAMSEGRGKGSAFEVRLPLPEEKLTPLPKKSPTIMGPKRSILLVDDNKDAVRSLSKLLTHYGHEVYVAHTGEDAISTVLAKRPEVVLLDIGLPDIDGYEVARQLRASGFEGHIAALTGYGQARDKEDSQQAGIDRHLVKPVNIEEVLVMLVELSPSPARVRT
jgi:signal transduction histidine kinase/ActR/RegA family two-component response regulator